MRQPFTRLFRRVRSNRRRLAREIDPSRRLERGAASLIAVSSALIGAADVSAQDRLIPRLPAPVVLDGVVDDSAWASIPSLPMTMFEPEFGGEIERPSVIRVAHDGEYLYAAGEFADEGEIRANSLVRDHYAEDDMFNLVIDSFNDERSAFWFLVTPHGTRIDGAITDDAEGESWNHPEFDNFWDAAAVMHDDGWSAEMRIPLSSLRFQHVDGRAVMGLIAGRLIPRQQERHTFPAIRPGPNVAQFKPSLAAKVRIEGIEAVRPLFVVPYVLGGWSGVFGAPDAPTRGWQERSEVGGDVKVALGRSLTLDLTVNTDFAQTEVDDERVNLTRFNLFRPEKRRFFLERSGVFDFGDGDEHRLFHSRRIGLSDDGRPERIYGGARLVGRIGGWDLGLVSMQTDRVEEEGSENSTVARVRRAVLNPNSYIGAILTTRAANGGPAFAAGGIDGSFRLLGSNYLDWNLAAYGEDDQAPDRDRLHARARLEKRDRRGLGYDVEVAYVGDEYRPPLGFVLRDGSTLYRLSLRHGAFDGDILQERILSLRTTARRRHADGALESGSVGLGWTGRRRGGGEANAAVRLNHEDLIEAFELSDTVVVPAGAYDFVDAEISLSTPAGARARTTVALTGGAFFDGWRFSAVLGPAWNASPHLEVAADLESNIVKFSERNDFYRAEIARLRLRASVNPHVSLHTLLQYNGADRTVGANLRFRYNFREGRDLYLVYTEGRSPTDAVTGVDGSDRRDRALLIKYTHTVIW